MKKSDKENKTKETKKISLIYLIIIIVICIVIGIFIGALTPVIDLFDNMFGEKEISEPINQYIKDKLDI